MSCCDTDKCCSPKQQGLGSIAPRRCPTDLPIFILTVVSYIVLAVFYTQARGAGADPSVIRSGVDLSGQVCGRGNLTEKSFAAWPSLKAFKATVCVESCDETMNENSLVMAQLYPSFAFKAYCVPDVQKVVNNSATWSSNFLNINVMASRAVSDLTSAWPLFLGAAIGSILVTFLIIFVIRGCAGVLVWGLLILAGILMIVLGGIVYTFGNDQSSIDRDQQDLGKALLYLSYIIWGLSALYFVTMFFLRTQISIAIAVTKEASKAMSDMWGTSFFTILPIGVQGAYLALWCLVATTIYAVGTFQSVATPDAALYYDDQRFPSNGARNSNPGMMQERFWDDKWKNVSIFLFFHGLWQAQATFYWAYMVISGTIADWYFTPYDSDGNKLKGSGENELKPFPVFRAMFRTVIFHLGTFQLAALILAAIRFIRYWILYLEKVSKSEAPNPLQKCVFASIICCLKCVECCIDKLNKNGLIWTAVYGDSFCTASCSAFALLWRNLARVAAINAVEHVITFIGKIATASIVTAVSIYVMQTAEPWSSSLYSIFWPTLLIFAFSYFCADAIFLLFEAILDTEFLCFLIDYEENGNGQMLASMELQKVVGKYAEHSEEQATAMTKRRSQRLKAIGYSDHEYVA